MKRLHALLLSGLFSLAAAPVFSQTLSSVPASLAAIDPKWASSFAAFDEADKLKTPAPGGVLFVGSSSIRLWDGLETQFESLPLVVKRGFGGSRMEDCKTYLSRLVVPYKPRMVLVYAGDNDLAEGRTPQQVLESFKSFVKGVRAELPDTRIAYISIKPSPSRAALMPSIRETNSLIRDFVGATDNADYIDIFSPMLSNAGTPRTELFREDALHLNAKGYALWRSVISAHLPARLTATSASLN
jgi:lysophospholipase L1-like esterase